MQLAESIGSAYLQVVPKMDLGALKGESIAAGKTAGNDFGTGFGGSLGDMLSGAGGVVTKVFGVVSKTAATAGIAAAGALAAVSKASFDAYASYEQLSGGISKLFGSAQDIVMRNAELAYQTAGMSANEYMEQVSGLAAALTNSLGGDVVKAAEQADVAMRAISDNVNTFGTDAASVQNAFQGFAKSNFTMLDNLKLGYGGTKAEMERLIEDANAYAEANGKAADLSIDSFSDIVTAIELIQEKQQIAGTTAKEAGTTIEGSIGAAKAAWTNLLTEFGKSDGDISKAMDNLVTSIIGDGTDSNKGVLGNVIPRIGVIAGNIAKELPGIVASVTPQLADALLTMIDEATGGLGTQVAEFLSPVTTALEEAFGSIGGWYESNGGAIDSVLSSLGGLAEVLVDGLGQAIATVAPIVGDLASGALPLLSGALDFCSGYLTGAINLINNLDDAFKPLTDVIAPVAEVIGSTLADALSDLGAQLATADFSGFAEVVSSALETVIQVVGETINVLTGFFDAVAVFMQDPIGAITEGFASLVGAGEATADGVSSSFSSMDQSVAASLSGVGTSIDRTNGKKLNDKKATATVTGNAVDGSAATNVGSTASAIGSLQSKSVDATVTGNAKDASLASNIWSTVDAIKSLFSKTVDVTARYRTENEPQTHAAGGIRTHASGFIANRYGIGMPLDIVGEDGAEAIIPLTNRRYTRPFADTVAEQMLARMGGMGGITVNLNYDASSDAEQIAHDIARSLHRVMAARG